MSKITWNEENTARLVELVGGASEVSQDQLVAIADELGTTPRSIGAKLRNLAISVEKAMPKASAWTADQEAELRAMVESTPNQLTYAEIAASFEGGAFTAKQVQGKLLSMELFHLVRKAERKAAPKTYTEEEEAQFISMANSGASIEDLAAAFGKPAASIRGKALSLYKNEDIAEMPKQEKSSAKERVDVLEGLDVANMSVAEIVEATGRTERGIKSTLSRRGISCSDYDGEAKRAKLDSKAS